jgi:hypothetical protein
MNAYIPLADKRAAMPKDGQAAFGRRAGPSQVVRSTKTDEKFRVSGPMKQILAFGGLALLLVWAFLYECRLL